MVAIIPVSIPDFNLIYSGDLIEWYCLREMPAYASMTRLITSVRPHPVRAGNHNDRLDFRR